MRKNIGLKLLIVLTILISTFSLTLSSAAQLRGDLNSDGSVNSIDFAVFRLVLLGADNLSDESVADLNGDDQVNAIDFAIFRQYLLGQIKEFPVDSMSPTPTETNTSAPIPTPAVTVPSVEPMSDDMNYVDANKSIHIQKVVKGSGSNIVTYYVADVKINDDSTILSAFSNGSYSSSNYNNAKVSKMATNNNAIFAINGDYYSFRKNGIELRNGKLYRNVPARDCLIIYKNGLMETANESSVSTSSLLENGVQQILSFGPVLVNSGTALTTFTNVPSDQGPSYLLQAHPRTGIGMIEPNHFIFIVVDGRAAGYSAEGMTMVDFAKTFADLGCKVAYNLDGGGSSTMYFNGKVINKPLGTTTERLISDILYIAK